MKLSETDFKALQVNGPSKTSFITNILSPVISVARVFLDSLSQMKRQPKGIWGSDVAAYLRLSLSWDAEDSRLATGRQGTEEQERSC